MTDITPSGDLVAEFRSWLKETMPEGRAEQVEFINEIRRAIHEAGPFAGEPVDFVEWVPADMVHANSYNPNAVAPPPSRSATTGKTAVIASPPPSATTGPIRLRAEQGLCL